jgi:hypothetical protein
MKLDRDAVIAETKVTHYLLRWQPSGDKSRFLASAGYSLLDASLLISDIRQLLNQEGVFEGSMEYGDTYRIHGQLTGPNGRTLRVVSAWMVEYSSGLTKFLTLFPDREA